MKNREWLRSQSEYDLLTEMNATFINGDPHCVLEVIEGKVLICKCEWIACQVSRAIKHHKKIGAICKKYESEVHDDDER